MSEDGARVIKPSLHHVNIKTTRLQEMIDWYIAVVGAKVNFRFPGGAFLSNDRANHRIAFLTVPGLHEHPEKIAHTGLHHTAFEYENFDDLMSSYARLKHGGIEPQVCLDHGLTTSLYYADPDQNLVELQVDNFSNWDLSSEWMRTSRILSAILSARFSILTWFCKPTPPELRLNSFTRTRAPENTLPENRRC